jgi:hypothetical protein
MKKIVLPCIIVLFSISLMAQNAANLKLKLEKNKVYRLKSISEQTISQTVNGIQQNTNVKSISTVSIKMLDATAEFFIADIRFDTMITNTNTMGKLVNYNSTLEGNIKSGEMAEVMSCIMNRLSKNALFVKMDYAGKVIEIVNLKMLSEIITKDTGSISGTMAAMIKMQVKSTVNEKSLKTMVEILTNNLPDTKNTTGNKWNNNMCMNTGGMSLDVATSYNMTETKGNEAKLSAESNIQASANAEPIDYGPTKVTYNDMKGLGESDMVLDMKTGLLINSSTKTHISGNLNITAPGMNMQMPMEIEGESKVIALP